jgi:hypothetical protein
MTVIAGAALILSFAKLKENILPATVIVAVVLGALTAADPKFCVWLNRLFGNSDLASRKKWPRLKGHSLLVILY